MKPIYSLNETFNKSPSNFSLNDCYVLGWIFADGHVNDTGVFIRIQKKDLRMLVKVKNYLGYGGPITIEKRRTLGKLVKHCKCQDRACLNIARKSFATTVLAVRNKHEDHTQLFENFCLAQQKAFIRGLMDGDGCVSYSNKTAGFKFETYWLLRNGFAKTVENWFAAHGFEMSVKPMTFAKPMSTIHIKGNNRCLDLFIFLYEDAEMFLNRKFRKFVRLINFNKKHRARNHSNPNGRRAESIARRLFPLR